MTDAGAEPARSPTWRRRLGAALAGLGIYLLVGVTAVWLPSALSDVSAPLGLIAGILVAGGLTPAMTVKDWAIAVLSVLAALAALTAIELLFIIWTWTPDRA